MKSIWSKFSIVDFVVVVAILLILAAIIVPSFVPPTGNVGASAKTAHQSAPANPRH